MVKETAPFKSVLHSSTVLNNAEHGPIMALKVGIVHLRSTITDATHATSLQQMEIVYLTQSNSFPLWSTCQNYHHQDKAIQAIRDIIHTIRNPGLSRKVFSIEESLSDKEIQGSSLGIDEASSMHDELQSTHEGNVLGIQLVPDNQKCLGRETG